MTAKDLLLLALAVTGVLFVVMLGRGIRAARARQAGHEPPITPTLRGMATGFVTNFFDTLGIGSFATTTAIFRQWNMVPDEAIPGTLNVGHTLPTIAQALIFTRLVPVDSRTLILMIMASVAGAWLGAGVITRWPRRRIQLGMGGSLLVAAGLMLASQLRLIPSGGEALALSGTKLGVGLGGNFLLGALMTMGIGLYGPCLILISLLGMNPTAAFPIMMGSCAFLMPVASIRFITAERYEPRATLGLAVGGIPAVLIAAYIITSLPLTVIRYLVVVVVVYTGVSLLRGERGGGAAEVTAVG
jgi:uncharacterized membrane protein YfcA